MIKLNIQHQQEYSRGELLLRTFFGVLYMALPHILALYVFQIWGSLLMIATFFTALFKGTYPEKWFDYQLKMIRWVMRLFARLNNLVDGYPQFGLNGTDDKTEVKIPYPGKVNQGMVLVRFLFGFFYVIIPHGLCLMLRSIAGLFLMIAAFWIVLFTGKYPENMHRFQVGTIRWQLRVQAYMMLMTDTYPPFTGSDNEKDSGLLDS